MTPNAVLARVFGVLESLGALAVGIGSLVAPLLIGLLGARGALLAVGAVTPVVCLLWWRRLTAIDRSVTVRTDDIMLLRQVPMLRPLPVPVLEQLAHGLHRTELAARRHGVRGRRHRRQLLRRSPTAPSRCSTRDRVVRTMGTGEGFGEIALLGNSTRTMTVRAVDPVELVGISSDVFLPAVTSMSDARTAAEATARRYLGDAAGER